MKNFLLLTLTALLTACSTPAPVVPAVDAKLAADYLVCDKLSTTGMLDLGQAMECSFAYERFLASMPGATQEERFKAFMAWWRVNKTPPPR